MSTEKGGVVVTGGGGALGRVVVAAFSRAGYRVAVPVRDERTGEGIEQGVFVAQCDLGEISDVRNFFAQARSRCGDIGVLINAAGGYWGGKNLEETTLTDLEEMMRSNLTSAFLACAEVLPSMKSNRFGRIINITARPALQPLPGRAAYAIAKRAVATLTECIAQETRGSGVTCNAVAPSIIRTTANEASMPGSDTSRWVTPDELAALFLHLASPEAGSINGAIIPVYGGM